MYAKAKRVGLLAVVLLLLPALAFLALPRLRTVGLAGYICIIGGPVSVLVHWGAPTGLVDWAFLIWATVIPLASMLTYVTWPARTTLVLGVIGIMMWLFFGLVSIGGT